MVGWAVAERATGKGMRRGVQVLLWTEEEVVSRPVGGDGRLARPNRNHDRSLNASAAAAHLIYSTFTQTAHIVRYAQDAT